MSNLYDERAESIQSRAKEHEQAFFELYKSSKSTDAQLVAMSVAYAGELIAAAIYEALAKAS